MYQLADINPGDGGLVCIPGSHKSAFPCPRPIATLEAADEFPRDNPYTGTLYEQVAAKKGSAVIFSEALTHGAQPWVASHQRRTLLYRYAAQGFASNDEGTWEFRDSLSHLGQAILEPGNFGNRPDIATLVAEEEELEAAGK